MNITHSLLQVLFQSSFLYVDMMCYRNFHAQGHVTVQLMHILSMTFTAQRRLPATLLRNVRLVWPTIGLLSSAITLIYRQRFFGILTHCNSNGICSIFKILRYANHREYVEYNRDYAWIKSSQVCCYLTCYQPEFGLSRFRNLWMFLLWWLYNQECGIIIRSYEF